MDKSVVSVKIYGQEYTVPGDKSREYIIKVADYVDQNMREIAAVAAGIPAPSLAVLASVNIADQYFETAARLSVQEEKCAEQEKDIEHYIKLWEEAKKNFVQFKEEAGKLLQQKEELRQTSDAKDKENTELKAQLEGLEEKIRSEFEEKIALADQRVKEAESNFFDLQMENIRLKSELERFKRTQNNF